MKQTLLITLFSIAIPSFIIASTDTITDKMAVVGSPALSSDPCASIDKKLIRLDAFTTMVNNTSAFHLEEKASALPVPGITVSNNKKKMLRDAKKKHAEYSAERQKYSCENPMPASTAQMAVVAKPTEVEAERQTYTVETPMTTSSTDTITDKMAVLGTPALSSDPCTAIDKKLIRLDAFTTMVNNTSAFHLEEKASALPVPGITVSNNKKKMLRDAKKKHAEYSAERQKYSCENPMPASTAQMAVVAKPTEVEAERQTYTVETPMTTSSTDTITDKMAVVGSPALSSDSCDTIDKKLIRLDAFTTMVNNTSAFHLEEKASALPVPGITVSNNKKKMLRDAEKKHAEYSAERQKYGCETSEK